MKFCILTWLSLPRECSTLTLTAQVLDYIYRYIIQDDIHLVGEVWNNGVFEDKLLGTFHVSVLDMLQSPFLTFHENLDLTMVHGSIPSKVLKAI